ncbi:MAG: PGF-CTERM sorting domain-containing protein [Candidatus Thermoplasmatota archaeon]|nr:PGF-CTERM sorting domain-containing protein [Candidatus Thermoplasmatota archaeon]
MTKRLRPVKATIVMGILLFSIFVACMPSSTAGILPCNPYLKLEYDASKIEGDIMPLGGASSIPINVGYELASIFADQAVKWLGGKVVPSIELSVEGAPDYCTAWVEPNVVYPELSKNWKFAQANVWVSFKESAPARSEVKLRIRMHSNEITDIFFKIPEVTNYAEISFTPGYLPIISVTPQGNFKEISPGEVATFDINLENLGNAKTEVTFRVLNFPEGWSPNIISSTTLGTGVLGENAKSTIQLIVQPPYNFGYHNDRETIQIEIVPSYYGDPAMVGRTYTEMFTIQSRGFSTPGFEAIFAVFALAGIALIVKKRRQEK